MYRKLIVLLAVLFIVMPYSIAEEEVSIFETLQVEPTPEIISIENVNTEEVIAEEETPSPEATQAEILPDGSISIIVTAVGDTTIGGDIRKSGKSIFDRELEKQAAT